MNTLLSIKNVCQAISVSRTTLWVMIRDGEFPRPVKIGAGRKAFLSSEVEKWIEQRVEERDHQCE